jgi:hypothetical protein
MDDYDQFKEVLGPLFDEMSKLDVEGLTLKEILTNKEFKEIKATTYVMQMPISGETAVDLATSLEHWVTEECSDCEDHLKMFTVQFVINLWDTIMMSLEIEDE